MLHHGIPRSAQGRHAHIHAGTYIRTHFFFFFFFLPHYDTLKWWFTSLVKVVFAHGTSILLEIVVEQDIKARPTQQLTACSYNMIKWPNKGKCRNQKTPPQSSHKAQVYVVVVEFWTMKKAQHRSILRSPPTKRSSKLTTTKTYGI